MSSLSPPIDRENIESDAALIRRVTAGDPLACRQLVDAHLRRVVGLAYRMLGDMAAAEDVAQESFLRLWRQAPRWQAKARIATWLYRVAHNQCIDLLRGRKTVAEDDAPEIIDPDADPAMDHQSRQVAAAVNAAMARLPERQRTAITLVHHNEVTNIEAAAIMGISVDALESLLARGRRRLKELLEDRKGDLMGEER
ncbi:MAG: RNA polymerase sigma factor [Rhodospirillales bacterium]